MAQKKMGRPKSDNPLIYEIRTRLDAETYARVLQYCEQSGIDKATFLRRAMNLLLKDK